MKGTSKLGSLGFILTNVLRAYLRSMRSQTILFLLSPILLSCGSSQESQTSVDENIKVVEQVFASNSQTSKSETAVSSIAIDTTVMQVTKLDSSAYFTCPCDTIPKDKFFDLRQFDVAQIFATTTPDVPIYCGPGWRNEMLVQLRGGTHVQVEHIVARSWTSTRKSQDQRVAQPFDNPAHHSVSFWHAVEYEGAVGYIHNSYLKAVENEVEHQYWTELMSEDNSAHSIFYLDVGEGKALECRFDDIMHGSRLHRTFGLALNGIERAYYYETYRESCPGHTIGQYAFLVDGQLVQSPKWSSTGEANFYESTFMYLPKMLDDGQIALVHLGQDEYLREEDYLGYGIFPYPDDMSIPIENLVVTKRFYTEDILDSEGNAIVSENGHYMVKEMESEPVYYFWNGSSIELID